MIEILSALEHERWNNWMKYLFSKGTKNADGTFTINAESVARWERQINTPYNELSEEEKQSDRNEINKFLATIEDIKNMPIKDISELIANDENIKSQALEAYVSKTCDDDVISVFIITKEHNDIIYDNLYDIEDKLIEKYPRIIVDYRVIMSRGRTSEQIVSSCDYKRIF